MFVSNRQLTVDIVGNHRRKEDGHHHQSYYKKYQYSSRGFCTSQTTDAAHDYSSQSRM